MTGTANGERAIHLPKSAEALGGEPTVDIKAA
jgi:hypothetical protein